MCDTYKRRIADQHLHPLVKAWWYGLTETQRNYWLNLVSVEKSRTKQTHDGTKGDMLYLVGNNLRGR